jgi:hypothetical protein
MPFNTFRGGHLCGQNAGKIGALVLTKQNRCDVVAGPDLVEDGPGRIGIIGGQRLHRLAVRIFEAQDEAKVGVRRAAHDFLALRHHIIGFDRPTFEPGFSDTRLKAGIGSVIP